MSEAASGAEQRRVHYTGRVQGVGFRDSTVSIASHYQVTGYVENLADGRVHLLVEGEPAEIERFLAAVAAAMKENIKDTQVERRAASGKFRSFTVRR